MSEFAAPKGAIEDGRGGWWATPRRVAVAALPIQPGRRDGSERICGAGHPEAGYQCSESVRHQGSHVAASNMLLGSVGKRRVLAVWHG